MSSGLGVRNFRVIAISPAGTVIVYSEPQGIHDTGETPAELGTWGLSQEEIRILGPRSKDRRCRK